MRNGRTVFGGVIGYREKCFEEKSKSRIEEGACVPGKH